MERAELVTFRTVGGFEMWFILEVPEAIRMADHIVRRAPLTQEQQEWLGGLLAMCRMNGLLDALFMDLQTQFRAAYRPEEKCLPYDSSTFETEVVYHGLTGRVAWARTLMANLGKDARINPIAAA